MKNTKRKFKSELFGSIRKIFAGWDRWGKERELRRFRKRLKKLLGDGWNWGSPDPYDPD